MSLNAVLMAALSTIAPTMPDEFIPDDTESSVDTYITFNYNSNPDDFGDDEPGHEVFSIQVHLFCPPGVNSLSMRRDIKKALDGAGFTWPSYVNASDKDGQHHVFECETAQSPGVE